MQRVMRSLGMLRRFVETLGPYLLLELLLPGGTLLAVTVFLYRRRKSYGGGEALRTATGFVRSLMSTFDLGSFALQPRYARPVDER
jgi:hypothetical protein